MRFEDTSGELRKLAERLFALVKEVSGERPQLQGNTDWYRAQGAERAFVYLRLIGERARTFPPNSVHLATKWNERLASEQVFQGNNWYGEPSADLAVQATNPAELGPAEDFIRRAFQLYGKRSSG